MSGARLGDSAKTRGLLNDYYRVLAEGGDWGAFLSDDFLLTGTVVKESTGRGAYVDNGFFKMVRGLRVKGLIVEGEAGFALVNYDLVSPKGRPFSSDVAEFWTAKEGKLDSVAIYFDTAAFSNSMTQ